MMSKSISEYISEHGRPRSVKAEHGLCHLLIELDTVVYNSRQQCIYSLHS